MDLSKVAAVANIDKDELFQFNWRSHDHRRTSAFAGADVRARNC